MRIPARIGQGNSSLSLGNTSEPGVALKEVLNEIAGNLTSIQTASQAADFATFKSEMAAISLIEQSTDA